MMEMNTPSAEKFTRTFVVNLALSEAVDGRRTRAGTATQQFLRNITPMSANVSRTDATPPPCLACHWLVLCQPSPSHTSSTRQIIKKNASNSSLLFTPNPQIQSTKPNLPTFKLNNPRNYISPSPDTLASCSTSVHQFIKNKHVPAILTYYYF